jgi:multidrug efflux pump subunit AcrA (membrane-fusion protein)
MKGWTLLAMLTLLIIFSCRPGSESEEPDLEAPRPAAVAIATVREGDVQEVLRVAGETSALSVVRLASPIAGRVTFLRVRPGDRLAAGEAAVRLLPLESEAAVNGFDVLERARAVAPSDQATARRLARELAAREVSLSAPFAAIVGERLKNPGEQLTPGEVIVELYDPRSLVVLAQIPIDSVPRLRKGMAAAVHTAAGSVAAEIDAVLPSLAPGTLTVPVRIKPSAHLEPPLRNAAVECEIVIATHRAARLIPRSALVSVDSPTEARVLVAARDHAATRKIVIGIRSGDDVEVLNGLGRGERVLVRGQFGLPDGAPIYVPTPQSAAPPSDAG